MPIEITYDSEKKILYGTIINPASTEDFQAAMENVTGSGDHPPNVSTLWDMRALDFTLVNRDFLDRLIAIRRQFPARASAKIAFAVADDLGFGMARMFENLSAGLPHQMMVFKNMAEAEAWLQSPAIDPLSDN